MNRVSEYNIHQLEDEINAMEQAMEICSYGVKDMIYLDQLYTEARDRGYNISGYRTTKLSKGDE